MTPFSLPQSLGRVARVLAIVLIAGIWAANARGESPVVLTHYMPWFSANHETGQWGYHWTMNHFDPSKVVNGKREIASAHYPIAGVYDSGDPDLLEYHVLLMRIAGIEGVIVDWYGLSDLYDYPVNHRNTLALIEQLDRFGLRFAICYEDQTLTSLVKNGKVAEDSRVSHVASEIRWMNEHWFQKANYVKLDDKPLLLSFGNTGLSDQEWAESLQMAKVDLNYISEHTRRECAAGAFDWPVPAQGLEQIEIFNRRRTEWKHFIPCAFPRFDDFYQEGMVNDGYPVVADNHGETLKQTLSKALESKAACLQIVTWNDWGEGTQIEPSLEHGYRDLELVQQQVLKSEQRSDIRKSALTLPIRLLELRRARVHAPGRLSKIADNLSAGRYEIAKKQIEFLDRVN